MAYKPSIEIERKLFAAIETIGDNIQSIIKGRLGRETDEVYDASDETGENGTLFARVEGQADAGVVYYDPMLFNLATLSYDMPVRMQRIDGKMTVIGIQPNEISAVFESGIPGAYLVVVTSDNETLVIPQGTAFRLLGGTGISTYKFDDNTVVADIGTHTHQDSDNGGTLNAAAIAAGTLAHERGGLEADVSAYDGFIRIASGATSNLKSTFNSTAAPTTGDDSGDGFVVGSRWLDTTADKEYVCLDNSVGAAVWLETTASGGGAPDDAKYWVSEASGDLSDEVDLGALTSGLLKHTVSGGVSTPATAASADVVGAIDDGAITGAKIAGGAIDASKLASNSVTTDKIVDGVVTTAKIANGNITTEKIADGNVTEAKLATDSVTTNKIGNGAVTSIKIGSSLSAKAIGSSSISNYLDFDEQGSNPSNPASTAIRAFSREFDGESELRLIDSNGIDQNVSDIIITVKNGTGSTIAKSRICKLTSLDGSDIQVFLAQANTFSGAQGILCFTLESIANGATGRALLRGVARTDLTGFAATSPGRVWLSTSSAGGITGTEPTTVAREVGVVRAGGTSGIFIFDPQSPNYAPYNADYWVSQSNSNLITEVNLGALANGIIQHSVSGGVSTPSSLAGSSAGDALRWSGSAWQAVGNAMTEITPFTQLNADTGSFTINSISGNYSHLLLQLQIKTDAATETDGVVFRLNGDTTAANYYNFSADISHSGVVSSAQALGTTGNFTIRRGGSGDAAAVANLFSIINIWIFNYTSANISSNRRIVVKWEGFTPSVTGGGLYVTTGGGHYLASAAVTSLTIAPNSGSNLKQNSSYALWGIG